MVSRRSLTEIVRDCESRWIEEYVSEADNNITDAQINLAEMLLRGAAGRSPSIREGVDYMIKATRRSAEAAFKLGKMLLKGNIIPKDINEATFYLKLATLYKCKCGPLAHEYHTHQISNAHPCYSYKAGKKLQKLNISTEIDNRFKERFTLWKHNKERNRK